MKKDVILTLIGATAVILAAIITGLFALAAANHSQATPAPAGSTPSSVAGSTPITAASAPTSATTSSQPQQHPVPTARFTCMPYGILNAIFDPRDSAAAPGFFIAEETFDYGDGTHETLHDIYPAPNAAVPVHQYATPGTYTVKLTVTDNSGEVSPPVTQQCVVTGPPPP